MCESDSVITLKCGLHVGVILQLRALFLFLFLFGKGVISCGSKQHILLWEHTVSIIYLQGLTEFLGNGIDARIALEGAEDF